MQLFTKFMYLYQTTKTFYKFDFRLKTGKILYKQSYIFYRQFGRGGKKLFCFHGYGESCGIFIFLEDCLGEEYTLIAVDLPFHAETEWNEGLTCTINDLIKIIDQFINVNETFCILGFSMGGRIALHLLETIPQKIKRVVLIAPDGLHKNFWYCFSTQTIIGNKLFAFTMKHPAWFLAMIRFSKTIKLINKSSFSFALRFLDNETERNLLYKRWTTFRKIKPNLSHLKKIVQQNSVQIKMLFGKYDRIILVKDGKKFSKGAKNKISVVEIESGHHLLRMKYADEIVKMFNS